MLSEDIDKVLFEGEILKYKLGMNLTYIKRWGQITRREFKYYKDRVHSSQWLAKPLGSIALNSIARISKVDIKIGNKDRRTELLLGKSYYQFEIFPKTQIINLDEAGNNGENVVGDVVNKKNEYDQFVKAKGKELIKVHEKQKIDPKGLTAWSNRQKEWEESENRLLFAHHIKEECDKWILLLNWLVDLIKQENSPSKNTRKSNII